MVQWSRGPRNRKTFGSSDHWIVGSKVRGRYSPTVLSPGYMISAGAEKPLPRDDKDPLYHWAIANSPIRKNQPSKVARLISNEQLVRFCRHGEGEPMKFRIRVVRVTDDGAERMKEVILGLLGERLRVKGCLHDAQNVGEARSIGERASGSVGKLTSMFERAKDCEYSD
jgi:hypothetical protein